MMNEIEKYRAEKIRIPTQKSQTIPRLESQKSLGENTNSNPESMDPPTMMKDSNASVGVAEKSHSLKDISLGRTKSIDLKGIF